MSLSQLSSHSHRLSRWTRRSPSATSQGHSQSNHGHCRSAADRVSSRVHQHVSGWHCSTRRTTNILWRLTVFTDQEGSRRQTHCSRLYTSRSEGDLSHGEGAVVVKLAPAQLVIGIQQS